MKPLLQKDLQAFQEQFSSFGDALVKSVNFICGKDEFCVEIEAFDSTCVPPRWRPVTLVVKDCVSMKFAHGDTIYNVLLVLHILFENENVGIEFGHFYDKPESMKELMTSSFYVVGKCIEWEVNDFQTKQISPDETIIKGKWFADNATKRIVEDDNCHRIGVLVNNYLVKLATNKKDWKETLYQDPSDGRYWERTYPQYHVYGGFGPAMLRNLSLSEAEKKYGKIPKGTINGIPIKP